MNTDKRTFTGVCHFYYEQGMEGGVWALQDERFILYVAPSFGVWGNQDVWDAKDPKRKGRTRSGAEVLHDGVWRPLPDPVSSDPDYLISSLFRGESQGDRAADARLMKKYCFTMKYAADRMDEAYGAGTWRMEDPGTAVTTDGTRVFFGGTPSTEPQRPYGTRENDVTRLTVEWQDGTTETRTSDTLLVLSWHYAGLHFLEDGDELEIFDSEKPDEVVWKGVVDLVPTNTLYTERATQSGVDNGRWANWFVDEKMHGRLKKKKLHGTCKFIGKPTQEWAIQCSGRSFLLKESHFRLKIYDKRHVGRQVLWNHVIESTSESPLRFWDYPDFSGTLRLNWARWFFREYPAEIEFLD